MKGTTNINYIQLLNTFWKVSKTSIFSTNDVALYFYLLDINNSCYWKESFSHNNRAIQGSLHFSFNTLVKARVNLQKSGLINFQTQNGSPNANYQILTSPLTLSNFDKAVDKVIGEIKKTKQILNNIIEDVVDFDGYKAFLKSEKSLERRNAIYELYCLKKGSLEKLADLFASYQATKGKYPKDTVENIHNHFTNWIQKQEELSKLNIYKNHSFKKTGSI